MKNRVYVLCILLGGLFWASSCLFVNKLAEWGFSSFECTSIRMITGAIILNAILLIKNPRAYKISLASYGICALSGICSVLGMCVFYFCSMERTSAATSAILLYTAPIFVMIMSVVFFKEKITSRKIVSFCLSSVGCALVSGIATGMQGSIMGIIYGMMGGCCYSIYGIIATFFLKLNDGKGTLTFTTVSFAFAAIGSLAVANPIGIVGKAAQTGSLSLMIPLFILFGICTAVLPFALYTKGLEGVRPDIASILAFIEPLAAAVFGIVILGQPFDMLQGIGIILVTSAIVILNLPQKEHNGQT